MVIAGNNTVNPIKYLAKTSTKEFLDQDNIAVFPINNAAKAMMLMNRIQPDLIFMDIGMPLIDGYQLCS